MVSCCTNKDLDILILSRLQNLEIKIPQHPTRNNIIHIRVCVCVCLQMRSLNGQYSLVTHGSCLSLIIMREVRAGNCLLESCPGAQVSTSGAMVRTISWYRCFLKLSGAMSAFTSTLVRQYRSSGIWYAGLMFACQISNRM